MRKYILLGFTLLLASCAANNSGVYTQSVKSWQGGNASSLLAVWGKPNTTSVGPGGNTVYVYKRQNYTVVNNNYAPQIGVNGRTNGTPVITAMPNVNTPWNRALSTYCLAMFTAAPGGKIVDTNIQGANCYISKSEAASLANPKGKA
jgi:hypothetical protein